MSINPNSPLDSEEEKERLGDLPEDYQQLRFYMEIIPIILISLGLCMQNFEITYWDYFLIGGGFLAAFMYFFFSWYMFRARQYSSIELSISTVCSLLFPLGFLGLIFKIESYPYAYEMIRGAVYGGLGLLVLAMILFVLNLKNEKKIHFYRNLIARLLIFAAILLKVFV